MLAYLQNSSVARLASGIGLSVLSAILVVLAFPPYQLWPLVFIGWVPMLIAQYHLLPSKWSSLAPALGIGLWLQGYLGPVFRPIGTFMVWLPLIVAVLTFLTDRGLQAFHQKTAYRWFVPMGVLNWAGTEMIRLFIPIAGTWAFIAYPLYRPAMAHSTGQHLRHNRNGDGGDFDQLWAGDGLSAMVRGEDTPCLSRKQAFSSPGEELVSCHGDHFGCLGEHQSGFLPSTAIDGSPAGGSHPAKPFPDYERPGRGRGRSDPPASADA